MDLKTLEELNDHFRNASLTFEATDWKYLAGKDTPRGRMLGFLTSEYYRREKLWQTGTIVWAWQRHIEVDAKAWQIHFIEFDFFSCNDT